MFLNRKIGFVALQAALVFGALNTAAMADSPRRPNAKMTYKSSVFFVPVLPPFSDGTAKKTAADCAELQSRLKAEKGDGAATRGLREFGENLESLCRMKASEYPNYARVVTDPVTGKRCVEAIWTECTTCLSPAGTPDAPVENWCKFWLNNVSVKDTNIVTVEFDNPSLPCDCQGKSQIIDCLGDEEADGTSTKQLD